MSGGALRVKYSIHDGSSKVGGRLSNEKADGSMVVSDDDSGMALRRFEIEVSWWWSFESSTLVNQEMERC